MKILCKNKIGSMLVVVLIVTSIFIMLLSGAISLGLLQGKLNKIKIAKAQALHIAEAGIGYYKWVLYHNENDYCNNEECISAPDYGPYGPYDFSDQSKKLNGSYQLYITPPSDGSDIIKVKSVGWVNEHPNVKRSIEVELGKTSLTSYLLISNENIRITDGTTISGAIHSNNGIRFDGVANSNSPLYSAVFQYDDPYHDGANEFGIHTHKITIDPLPPASVPERSDVFGGGRFFPVSKINISSLDSYVADMYTLAQNDGLVLDYSGAYGYYIEFMPSSSPKIKIYKVTSTTDPCRICLVYGSCIRWKKGVCQEYNCAEYSSSIPTYGIVSVDKIPGGPSNSQYDVPENGIIFIKDNVWIDASPHVNSTQVTVLAFKEPFDTGEANIIINNGTSYKRADSSSVIGLIAQNNILLGIGSADNLEIDAAMIAKTGKIGREEYPSYCGTGYTRNNLQIFGSMVTMGGYGFSHFNNAGNITSGYSTINLIYDGGLILNPPPYFPVLGEYGFLSWKEN